MKTILRRVGRLEDCYRTVAPKAALRVVVSSRWKGAVDWNTSTCRRTLHAGHGITEIVDLDGSDEGVGKAELQKFISGFPIEMGCIDPNHTGRGTNMPRVGEWLLFELGGER